MPLQTVSAVPPPRTSPQHHDYIDALRGVALLAVLAFHFGFAVQGLPRFLGDVLGRGYAGVQLFFVVSCFTLCTSLVARRDDRSALVAYFVRRAFRILPMFWFAILLYMSICGFDGRWSAPDGIEARHILLSALLLHGFDPHAINGVVPGGWSVATEVQFYLVLPVLVAVATSLRRAIAVFVVALAISVLAQPVIAHGLAPLLPAAQLDIARQFAFYTLPAQLPVFACGLVLYRLMGPDRSVLTQIEMRLPSSRRFRAATVLAFVLVVGLPPNLASHVPSLVKTFPGHIGYGILAALLIYAFATYPKASIFNRSLGFVGRVSYSGYLLHFAVLDQAVTMMPPSVKSQPLLYLALLAGIVLPITLAAAWLTYVAIEKPGIALGRRIIVRLKARSASNVLEQPREALVGQGVG